MGRRVWTWRLKKVFSVSLRAGHRWVAATSVLGADRRTEPEGSVRRPVPSWELLASPHVFGSGQATPEVARAPQGALRGSGSHAPLPHGGRMRRLTGGVGKGGSQSHPEKPQARSRSPHSRARQQPQTAGRNQVKREASGELRSPHRDDANIHVHEEGRRIGNHFKRSYQA